MKHIALTLVAALLTGCATTAPTTTDELPEYKVKQKAYYENLLEKYGSNESIRKQFKDDLCTTERLLAAKRVMMIRAARTGVVEVTEPLPASLYEQPEPYRVEVRKSCTCQRTGICLPMNPDAWDVSRAS